MNNLEQQSGLHLDRLQTIIKGQDMTALFAVYRTLQSVADEIQKEYYCGKETIKFPIDIRRIVDKCGINLYEVNLNVDTGFQLERIRGYIRRKDIKECSADNYEKQCEIYIDRNDNEETKRYVIAHEFCHYILDKILFVSSGMSGLRCCVDPLFSKEPVEIYTDIMAAFLLFPPCSVLDCMKSYCTKMRDNNKYPIDVSEWMRVLGQHAQVSTHYTIICYQHLKVYLTDFYQSEIQQESNSGLLENYGELFI